MHVFDNNLLRPTFMYAYPLLVLAAHLGVHLVASSMYP